MSPLNLHFNLSQMSNLGWHLQSLMAKLPWTSLRKGSGARTTGQFSGFFNPFVRANSGSPPAALYRRHEREKIRTYEQRVLEVEHGSFTPLVLSATGGMAPLATPFYRTNRPRRGSATFRRLSAWSDASLHLAIACSGRRSAA